MEQVDNSNMGNQNSTGNSDLAEGIEFISHQMELDLQCSSSHFAEVQCVSMVMTNKKNKDGGQTNENVTLNRISVTEI